LCSSPTTDLAVVAHLSAPWSIMEKFRGRTFGGHRMVQPDVKHRAPPSARYSRTRVPGQPPVCIIMPSSILRPSRAGDCARCSSAPARAARGRISTRSASPAPKRSHGAARADGAFLDQGLHGDMGWMKAEMRDGAPIPRDCGTTLQSIIHAGVSITAPPEDPFDRIGRAASEARHFGLRARSAPADYHERAEKK